MHGWLYDHLRLFFAEFGYWAVALVLLLENAGVPVPGETTLLFASFLAYSEHRLYLPWIIVTGVIACTLGDNAGYWIGRRGGRALLARHQRLFHLSEEILTRGERLFARYGAATVFFARFVFGMRIIAGPLAGVLHMRWPRFALFNFFGAAVWVTTIACAGYFFGSQWERLTGILGRANIAIILVVVALGAFALWRQHRASAVKY